MSLAEARLRRAKAKVVLGEADDPGASNRPRAQMTFEVAARKWHSHRLDALDAGHAARLLARIERDAFPVLGKLALPTVTPADVLAMVRRGTSGCSAGDAQPVLPGMPECGPSAFRQWWIADKKGGTFRA